MNAPPADAFQTPMMRQYAALKAEQPDALLLYRCGDFYETYGEDASELGRLLNMVVTRKAAGADGDVAMSGFPYHAIEQHLAKLVRLGKRVAIAEQTEDPKAAKGLVRREIVRVVTPGTAVEDTLLESGANNHLVALCEGDGGRWGLALADVSTGFFALTEFDAGDSAGDLATELARVEAREILMAEGADDAILRPVLAERPVAVTRRDADSFRHGKARALLLEHFRVQSLDGFGAEDLPDGVRAAGALLRYLRETQRAAVGHLSSLRVHHGRGGMVLDAVTQRSLELVRNLHGGGRENTLLEVLDRTATPMGARMLRQWVLQPLAEAEAIEARLDAVEDLARGAERRGRLRELLAGMRDIERIASRASLGHAGPRDLAAMRGALLRIPALAEVLGASASGLLRGIAARLDPLPALAQALADALVDAPPASTGDGGVLRDGFHAELDELRALSRDSKDWIARFREQEAARTGVDKLKIGYNKVFGYYIELTHAQIRAMPGGAPPEDYHRKQTLANGERYITAELKEKEDVILHAEERALALEARLFEALRREVADASPEILADAELVATADCLLSLAEVALSRRFVRPRLNDEGRIDIRDGRHPVLEAIQSDPPFVPNDVAMAEDEARILLITGPNMAGKSTYIRQAALLVLMAHLGSFVPAASADIALCDRVFTRVGAMDHLARGQSTFLVEMAETANILRNATDRSLVILDEIGRGTSTYDGMAIAWAVCEYLHNARGRAPKTLFATHYHELTALAGPLPRLRNLHVGVLEEKDRIVFLFKVLPGAADQSYGIHAAEFAGVPPEVVARAREILAGLEKGEEVAPRAASGGGDAPADGKGPRGRKRARILPQADPWEDRQLSLFDSGPPHPAVERLKLIDPHRLTPIEALAVLAELKKLAEGG